MADEIPNALTPEEWASPLREVLGAADVELLSLAQRHRNAAICLDGHPHGFTDVDVEILQGVMEVLNQSTDPTQAKFYGPYLTSLGSRLAAILRPDDTDVTPLHPSDFPDLTPELERELNRRL